jgi:hypothetical protein
VVLDTVYWGRNFGLMVFKEANKDKVLYWQYVKYETIALYLEGLRNLESQYEVKAIVCDGRLLRTLSIPTQMCQFHQMAIITRYLTRNPKLAASIELQSIVKDLPKIRKKIFKRKLSRWHKKWESFLCEKTLNEETGRWRYTHRRLRSAFRSLERNIEYLFTYQEYPELKIPNTTNEIEGLFTFLKTKMRIHSGMNYLHRKKLLNYLLSKKS